MPFYYLTTIGNIVIIIWNYLKISGLIPVPIEPVQDGDQLCTNLDGLKCALEKPAQYLLKHWPEVAKHYCLTDQNASNYGSESVVCVLSTTSCFAPRTPDK